MNVALWRRHQLSTIIKWSACASGFKYFLGLKQVFGHDSNYTHQGCNAKEPAYIQIQLNFVRYILVRLK